MKKDNYILSVKPAGVSATPLIHDTSAAISKNGKIIAAVEEERFARIKHATGIFPIQSISYCLKEAGVDFPDLESIVIPMDPVLKRKDALSIKNFNRFLYRYKISKKYKEESSLVGSTFSYLDDENKLKMRILTF